MTPRARLLAVIVLGVLVAGAFYLRVLTRRLFFEPPWSGEDVARARLSEAALQPAGSPTHTARLYFPSYEQGALVAEQRQVAWAESDTDRIRQVLLALLEGSHLGHTRGLPSSTKIRAVFLASDGTAYLDFSNEALAEMSPGIASECLAVYSLVNSLAANIPAVKKVKILLQGQEVETLGGHADLTDRFVPDPARVLPSR